MDRLEGAGKWNGRISGYEGRNQEELNVESRRTRYRIKKD